MDLILAEKPPDPGDATNAARSQERRVAELARDQCGRDTESMEKVRRARRVAPGPSQT